MRYAMLAAVAVLAAPAPLRAGEASAYPFRTAVITYKITGSIQEGTQVLTIDDHGRRTRIDRDTTLTILGRKQKESTTEIDDGEWYYRIDRARKTGEKRRSFSKVAGEMVRSMSAEQKNAYEELGRELAKGRSASGDLKRAGDGADGFQERGRLGKREERAALHAQARDRRIDGEGARAFEPRIPGRRGRASPRAPVPGHEEKPAERDLYLLRDPLRAQRVVHRLLRRVDDREDIVQRDGDPPVQVLQAGGGIHEHVAVTRLEAPYQPLEDVVRLAVASLGPLGAEGEEIEPIPFVEPFPAQEIVHLLRERGLLDPRIEPARLDVEEER